MRQVLREALRSPITRDERGAAAIEMAFALPVLLALSLGGFETSQIVARQTELQSALSEAEAIMLAKVPENSTEVATIEDVVEASTGLPDAQVVLVRRYRCNSEATLRALRSACAASDTVSEYLQITITDTYVPKWAEFGLGHNVEFNFTRTVQIA